MEFHNRASCFFFFFFFFFCKCRSVRRNNSPVSAYTRNSVLNKKIHLLVLARIQQAGYKSCSPLQNQRFLPSHKNSNVPTCTFVSNNLHCVVKFCKSTSICLRTEDHCVNSLMILQLIVFGQCIFINFI